jgi:hypothetical protein
MMGVIKTLSPILPAFLALFTALPARAGMMNVSGMSAPNLTQTAGPYKITLVLLPAEPFLTRTQYERNHPATGMVVVGGATPLQPTSPMHPNHHLVAHVYRADGTAVLGAPVTMVVEGPGHTPMRIPIVEMEAAGKGPQSTHYGNNVRLADGTYRVTVSVGRSSSTTFSVRVRS